MRDQLAIDEAEYMVVFGACTVFPKALQRDVLQNFLVMHQGDTKLRQRAGMSVYWPGIDAEIANATRSCEECTSRLPPNPPEPLRCHDLVSNGQHLVQRMVLRRPLSQSQHFR